MVIGGLITVRWGLNYFFVLPGFFLDWGDGTYSNTGIIQLSKKTVAGKKLKLL
jgi:hypothetical protein